MNIMKQFIRNPGQALATLVLAAFAITLGLPAGEAGAADRPKWLEVKIAERKVVRNAKITDPDKPGYYEIFLRIRHTNKSADRVVTALYDKKGSFQSS